ncbi:MAG TPA: RNA 2',3'-cyclic phosphodiesterase [Pirellulaceae bacterium]|nr:RNA 2',3'-cyclic phosphodiesterase [Pirellulaceae bacterium]
MSLIRTFIAIQASDEVRRRCATLIRTLAASDIEATWTRTQNLHHTLKFLGDTADTQLPNVCRAMARAAATVEPFVLESVGVGAFPRIAAPRTVWVGAGTGAEAIIALHDALDQELYEVGFALEARRFQPHLTLGRVRKAGKTRETLARLIDDYRDFQAGHTSVSEVALLSSVLQKGGPVYEVLGRAPLAAR